MSDNESDGGGDASVDAPALDATAGDAGADSAFDASTTYCAGRTTALFCDDFDRTTPLAALWDSTTLPGAIGLIDSSHSRSAPSSLSLVADASTGPLANLSLHKVVTVGPSAVAFRFQFRPARTGAGPSVVKFNYASGFGYYAYMGETINVRVGGPIPEMNIGTALISVNQWHLIEFVIEPPTMTGAGHGRLTLKVDGTVAIGPRDLDPAANAHYTTSAAIDVGIVHFPTGSWSGWIDDVEVANVP
ncbi:MAG: hypothetical protein BGO98_39180 [Myxococcales bacterium 68-20]|nr:MAG: hypothetical protein BGO98_39180 [Myxococcales bacterium 68-20]